MNLLKQRLFLVIGIVIFLFYCVNFNANAEDIESPICPIIYSDGCGGFELYWFYPGKNKINVGNNTIVPEGGVIPSTSDRQYCVFTTISLAPPYYIESVNTYIRNEDMFPDLPGDQFTPIRLAVKEKVSNNYYEDIWYDYVNLGEDADFAGEIVGGATDLGIDDLFDIYLAIEWLPDTPTSPIIGVNGLPPYYYQAICPMDDSGFQAVDTDYGFMVGAEILSWHTNNIGIDKNKNDNVINYEVLFSNDSTDLFSGGEIIALIDSDSLTASFNLIQSGYITVKAKNVGGDENESYSEILFIDINRVPPVSIQSQRLFLDNLDNSVSDNIVLENSGVNSLELSINYDTSLFVLSDNSIILEPGTGAEITVDIKNDIDLLAQTSSPIIIRTAGNYYPQIVYIILSGNGPTSVDDKELLLPEEFNVSQPYPNPFNSSVRFNLVQSNQSPVQMDIYNLLGKKVFSQVFAPHQRHSIRWDGIDKFGRKTGSGMFFIRFSSGNATIIRKAVLLK